MSKISIIIPIYNTKPEYFNECLKSAVSNKTEIIVIDDGSTIDYSDITSKYDNINYIKTANHGVSCARNIGILTSTKEYVTFLDSDDYLNKNAIEKFENVINGNDIVLSRNYIMKDGKMNSNLYNGNSANIANKRDLINTILISNNPLYSCVDTPWAKAYSKKFLIENNIKFNDKVKNGEDVLFNYECYNKAKNIYYLNDFTYYYRVNPFSTCNTFFNDLDDRFFSQISELYKFIIENNINEPLFEEYVFRVVCRLVRKYYSYYKDYDIFKNKVNKLFNEPIIMKSLKNINIEILNDDKKVLIKSLNNRDFNNIYRISNNSKNMNIK